MASINISKKSEITFTPIDNIFIDRFMAKANGTYVKIYLYILRKANSAETQDISTASIAKALDILESDVVNCLKYWDSLNVLTFSIDNEKNNITIGILPLSEGFKEPNGQSSTVSFSSSTADTKYETNTQKRIHMPSAVSQKPTYMAEEISIYINNSDEVKNIFSFAEQQFGRPLKYEDYNILLGIYDWLKTPIEVIYILIQYCSSANYNIRYMEKVAIDWSKKNIDTKEKALNSVTEFDTLYAPIMKYLGMNSLNEIDKSFINTWAYDYGFDLKIILKAIEISIQTAGSKASMKYINKVLEDWKNKNLKTIAQIEKSREEWLKSNSKKNNSDKSHGTSIPVKKNKFLNFPQTKYDFDKIEKMDLERTVQEMKKEGIINESSGNN